MKITSVNAQIAISLMQARWQQTLVAAVGVTFSITMFITLLGFMNGLNEMLDGLILNRTAHVRLFNDLQSNKSQPLTIGKDTLKAYAFIHSVKATQVRRDIYNSGQIMTYLQNNNEVLGVSPRLNAQILYNAGTIDITGVLNGIDANAESALFHFTDYISGGDARDLSTVPNAVILGKGVANLLQAEVDDVIQVTTSTGNRLSLKVVAYFQSGIADYDKVQSFVALETVQKLLGVSSGYMSDIQIKLKDLNNAPAFAKEISSIFKVNAEDIQTANAQFETGSFIRSLISYVVGITLLIVAGFGIYNILNMLIYEKLDSIAILKATGFSGSDVRYIFMFIALSIGFLGGLAGLGFGYIMLRIIDQVPFTTAALPTIDTYPISYNPAFFFIGIIFSIATTFFAGFFPARKASTVDPVIIIRGK